MNQNKPDQSLFEIFEELLSMPSPSGHEHYIVRFLQKKLESMGYSYQTDDSGNTYVLVDGLDKDAPLCCVAAHIDEIAIVVFGIDSDGSLRVIPTGGLLAWKLGERPVDVLGDHSIVTGVVSMGSGHTSSDRKNLEWSDVRILTGMSNIELSDAGVRPGTGITPKRNTRGPILFGDQKDPMVAAWTFDDRMGAAVLLKLLDIMKAEGIRPKRPTIIAFTTQEEVGGVGAKVLARNLMPETFIAIDGCSIIPGSGLQLDGNPGIWTKDQMAQYDSGLIKYLRNTAREIGTNLQTVVYENTFSDAGMVYSIGCAQRVVCFGHIRENSHGYEVARLSVFDNVLKILVKFIQDWDGE
jgi:putative aminopeptidase FrvX